MTFYSNTHKHQLGYFPYVPLLVICWVAGLVIGCCFFKPTFSPLMCSAVLQPVSIVGLFVSVFLPLILSYFSFCVDKPIIVMIVCFLKAVAIGFTGMLATQVFSTASWLILFLLAFSDACILVVLFVLWFRYYSGVQLRPDMEWCAYTAVSVMIAMVDYFVVSPFLVGLF